jgi:hypothetical protein
VQGRTRWSEALVKGGKGVIVSTKEVVGMRKLLSLTCTAFLIGLLASGCALSNYGSLRLPHKSDAVTISSLQGNWQDYEIHYAGIHAGHPSAVLFDRKDDGREIVTERWSRVKTKETLDDLVDSIERQLLIAAYYPRLWKIIGPDGHIYGYMFTAWDHAVMRAVDENTLIVNDLPLPPYLKFSGKGGNGK